jgi:integrase
MRCAAGLSGIRFHDLRATYITVAAEVGVPLEVLLFQVGHISAAQTRAYVQIRGGAMTEALEAIEKRYAYPRRSKESLNAAGLDSMIC